MPASTCQLAGLAHAGQYQELTAYIDDLVGSGPDDPAIDRYWQQRNNAVIGDLAATVSAG